MVSSMLSSLLLLALVSWPVVVAGKGSPCAEKLESASNGTLTISATSGTCKWNFNAQQQGKLVIVVETSSLSLTDSVKLTDKNDTTVAEFIDVISPGIFLTNVNHPGVTLSIALDPNVTDQRNVKYHFSFVSTITQVEITAPESTQFIIPLNKPDSNPLTEASLKVSISPKSKRAALIEVIETNTTIDLDGSDGLISLSRQEKPSILTIKSFNSSSTKIVLATENVGPECSSIMTSPGEVNFDIHRVTMPQPVCAVVVKSGSQLFIDLKDLILPHVADSITFFNGLSLASPVNLQVVASSLAEEKKKLSNKILNQSSLILYRGSPGKRNASVASLKLVAAVKSQVNVENVTVEGGASEYFIFKANQTDKRVAFKPAKTTGPTIDFYCQDDVNASPFFSVLSNMSMPPVIYSPSGYLRVVAVKDNLAGSFSQVDSNVASTTLCEESDALVIKSTQVPANGSASFLIPTRPGKEAVIRVSPLFLNIDDSFTITSLTSQSSIILNETYNASIVDAYLPAIRLGSNAPHLLTFTRGASVDVNSPAPQISLAYLESPPISNISLATNESYRIPLSSSQLEYFEKSTHTPAWTASCSDAKNLVHLSFSKVDLGKDQTLLIGKNQDKSDTFNETSRLIPDSISKSVQLALNSPLPQSNARGASGSGFVAAFRSLPCADELAFPATKSFSINGTDCIYIVSAPQGDLLKMNVTINGDAKRANLTIIDDVTSSSLQLVNTTLLNETLISTKSSVIILFKTDAQANPPNLTVSLDKTNCSALNNGSIYSSGFTCDNGERCIPQNRRCGRFPLCLDKTDLFGCNGTDIPRPPDTPCTLVSSGLSGWAVFFLLIIAVAVGYFGNKYGPNAIGRLRNNRYSDFSNLAEDT